MKLFTAAIILLIPFNLFAADCFIVAGQSNALGINGTGPEIGLSDSYFKEFGERPEIVKFAVGGTSIERWIPTGDLYGQLLASIDRPCHNFVWIQGEADSKTFELATAYYENSLLLFNSLKADLGYPIDIFIAEVSSPYPFTFEVAKAERKLGKQGNVYLVPTFNLPKRSGGVHYTPSGLKKLGFRIFDIWKSVQ